MTPWWMALFVSPGHAGCAVDTERDARQRAAPVVAVGEVVSIEVTEDRVFERVALTDVLRGEVTRGGLLLRTGLPNQVDTSPIVYPPGARVQIVGSPDADGAVPISPCNDDVRFAGDLGELRALARKGRRSAGTVDGVSPEPPAGETVPELDLDGPGLIARVGEASIPGVRLEDRGDTVLGLFDLGEVEGVHEVPTASLRPVLARDWALTDRLRVLAGTPIDELGAVLVPTPEDLVGVVYTRGEPRPEPPDGGSLVPTGEIQLFGSPTGEPLLTVSADERLHSMGEPRGDRVPVFVDGAQVVGEAWALAGSVEAWNSVGVAGSSAGASSNTDPIPRTLAAGTLLLAPHGPGVVGRVGDAGPATVIWLTSDDRTTWVLMRTPWGDRVAAVR